MESGKRSRPGLLVRTPRDRRLLRVVEESRFIASTDLYLIDGRSRRDLSRIVRDLRRAGHLPIVSSAGRLPPSFYPKKTYVYGSGRRGHIVHWLYVAHLHALFTQAARELGVDLEWRQSNKHRNSIPDAEVSFPSGRYVLEVDNSTEGMRADRIAGKLRSPGTLVVFFRSEGRFHNLCELAGEGVLLTYHGYFHDAEENSFNILTEPVWWDGHEWRAIYRSEGVRDAKWP